MSVYDWSNLHCTDCTNLIHSVSGTYLLIIVFPLAIQNCIYLKLGTLGNTSYQKKSDSGDMTQYAACSTFVFTYHGGV